MEEPVIFAIAKLIAGIAGVLSTSPFSDNGVPTRPLIDVSLQAPAGYEISLVDENGDMFGNIQSPLPVRADVNDLPANFLNAVIAAEDRRFLDHSGIDPFGTMSALLDTIRGDKRGGSGIAQQMVKNTVVGPQVTYERKAVEAMLAVRMQSNLGHREVLRRYLQAAWFGRGVTGAMPASRVWFGKDWDEVSLAEIATLAAILKGPGYYDPYRFPERVKPRRDLIISVMERQGWVSEEDADEARAEEVVAIPPSRSLIRSPWVLRAAGVELAQSGPVVPPRGEAIATIDPDWQVIAEEALASKIRALSPVFDTEKADPVDLAALQVMAKDEDEDVRLPPSMLLELPLGTPYRTTLILDGTPGNWDVLTSWGLERNVSIEDPHAGWRPAIGEIVPALPVTDEDGKREMEVRVPTIVEGAVVILDPRNGEILASVGGIDGGLNAFDRTRALRQPGSAIKPFLYLAALDGELTPQSIVEDVERTYRSGGQNWRPRNYDRSQLGRIPMYAALERSLNVATVWLANLIGIEAMADVAERAGIYDPGGMVRVLPSALGASETTPLRLTAGYAAIVNDGVPRTPHILRELRGNDGTLTSAGIFSGSGPIASGRAVSDALGMMRGVVVRGTAYIAFDKHPVAIAGKTGTTQNHRDAWFVGVTPHVAIGIWIGRDDNRPLPGTFAGGSHAAPIAADILRRAYQEDLINSDGYRDERMTSGISWPPEMHSKIAAPIVSATPGAAVDMSRPAPRRQGGDNPVYARPDDAFWGRRVEPDRPFMEAPDANADLLRW